MLIAWNYIPIVGTVFIEMFALHALPTRVVFPTRASPTTIAKVSQSSYLSEFQLHSLRFVIAWLDLKMICFYSINDII